MSPSSCFHADSDVLEGSISFGFGLGGIGLLKISFMD